MARAQKTRKNKGQKARPRRTRRRPRKTTRKTRTKRTRTRTKRRPSRRGRGYETARRLQRTSRADADTVWERKPAAVLAAAEAVGGPAPLRRSARQAGEPADLEFPDRPNLRLAWKSHLPGAPRQQSARPVDARNLSPLQVAAAWNVLFGFSVERGYTRRSDGWYLSFRPRGHYDHHIHLLTDGVAILKTPANTDLPGDKRPMIRLSAIPGDSAGDLARGLREWAAREEAKEAGSKW